MLVLDSSAMIEVLLASRVALAHEARLFSASVSFHAPHLLDLEVGQVFRRFVRSGEMSPTRARQALEDLEVLRVHRYPHGPMMARIWQLRDNFSAYDAAYIVLAETLDVPLLTMDRRVAKAPTTHGASVELLESPGS